MFPIGLSLLALPLIAGVDGEPEVSFRARMPAVLTNDQELELTIDFALDKAWKLPDNPLLGAGTEPVALLQIEVPPGVRLVGPEARSLPELLASFFLDRPHEVLLEEGPNRIAFRVSGEPEADARFELNVLLYAQPAGALGTSGSRLIRQRFALPLSASSISSRIDASESDWGRGDVLQLGDVAPAFALKSPFGAPAVLEDLLQDGPLVVTTYRSCL